MDSTLSNVQGWRPAKKIRAKVIAIAKHNARILVCEVLGDDGRLEGWVPPGGGIEFGETAEAALCREMREEFDIACDVTGPLVVCQNIYTHAGAQGHEIIFALPVSFRDSAIYERMRFQYRESSGALHFAEWVEIERFRTGSDILFPAVIAEMILSAD